MEILSIFIKVILFLVGALFLASGLFCGAIGLTSLSAIWIGLIGLAFAALGGFLIAFVFGLTGKKKVEDSAVPPSEPGGPAAGHD